LTSTSFPFPTFRTGAFQLLRRICSGLAVSITVRQVGQGSPRHSGRTIKRAAPFSEGREMSALERKADIDDANLNVCF
jgi:hypothetical protein